MSVSRPIRADLPLSASARAEKQRAYVATTPLLQRGLLARALGGEGSPRNAIKAKCLTCCNFDRAEISDCRVVVCPIWAFRPYQHESEA